MNIIMLLDNCFHPDIRVYKEAKYLVDNGNNVEIVCLDKKNENLDKPVEELDGIKIKRFFPRTPKTTSLIEKNLIIRKFKMIIYLFWLLKFMFQVKKYLRNVDFEILHCHDIIMAFCACLFFKDKKIVFDMHEYYLNKNNKLSKWLIGKIVKFTQNKVKWIIYLNDFQLKDISEKNKSKLVYLPNYPLEKDYLPIDKEKSEKLRINYIGFLRDYEALKNLMKSAECDEKIHIGLYGSGDCYERLLKENKYGNVTIYGKFNGVNDSNRIYRHTDILYCVYNPLVNNWKNAYPVKLYEGIVTRTPIIVAEGSKAGEFVVEYKIGETVKYGDCDSLKNAIRKIDANYQDYLQNLELIRQEYRWEDVSKNLDQIYS